MLRRIDLLYIQKRERERKRKGSIHMYIYCILIYLLQFFLYFVFSLSFAFAFHSFLIFIYFAFAANRCAFSLFLFFAILPEILFVYKSISQCVRKYKMRVCMQTGVDFFLLHLFYRLLSFLFFYFLF